MWVVEIDFGALTWTTVAHCDTKEAAERLRNADHILAFGKPVRAREYGKHADGETAK